MPQTNVLPDWRATYPNDAPVQKPSAVPGTVIRTASASVWAAGVVTLTVPAVLEPVGSSVNIAVAGFTPAGYNGSYQGTIASATSITYPLASSPGLSTVQGTVSYQGMNKLTISTTLPATAVPNKPQWTGTQMAEAEAEEGVSRFAAAEETEEAEAEAEAAPKNKKRR